MHHKSLQMNKHNGSCSCKMIAEQFSHLDMFGIPINLNYKGQNAFRTPWGACVTIIMTLLLAWALFAICLQTITQPIQKHSTVTYLANPSLYDLRQEAIAVSSLASLKLSDPASFMRIVNMDPAKVLMKADTDS